MGLQRRGYETEEDFWRIRNFLRAVYLLNEGREQCWPVARLDHWRWHLVQNCQYCAPVAEVISLWESANGELGAVLHPVVAGEIRLHIHPSWRTIALEEEMLAFAETHLALLDDDRRRLHLAVDADDTLRQQALLRRGFTRQLGRSHKWWRDLARPVPEPRLPAGYILRAMGELSEHSARSWASWRAFHADEPDENYDGDWSWYQNIQAAPLYRRDLDVVAVAPDGAIASFATIYYDDATRSAVCVLVGTAAEHQRRGLGRAVLLEGFIQLQRLGATRVFATGYDVPASTLYGSVMDACVVAETWRKEF
jgi:GNAT superfamily N-acetyltransferase